MFDNTFITKLMSIRIRNKPYGFGEMYSMTCGPTKCFIMKNLQNANMFTLLKFTLVSG